MPKRELPKHAQHAIDEGQAFIDAIVARYGDGSQESSESYEADPEEQVILPLTLWEELQWMEDGPINDAVQAASSDGEGFAEGEEMGEYYIFYCGHVESETLRLAVQNLLDDHSPREFTASVVPVPSEIITTGRDKVILVGRTPPDGSIR